MSFTPDKTRFAQALTSRKDRVRPNILLAEDDKLFRIMVSKIVSERFDLHLAHDGMEALNLYQNLAPDIAFFDISMPRIDGLTALGILTELDPNAFIIMLTGSNSPEHQEQARKSGAKGFITKPYTPAQINEYFDLYWEQRSAA